MFKAQIWVDQDFKHWGSAPPLHAVAGRPFPVFKAQIGVDLSFKHGEWAPCPSTWGELIPAHRDMWAGNGGALPHPMAMGLSPHVGAAAFQPLFTPCKEIRRGDNGCAGVLITFLMKKMWQPCLLFTRMMVQI